MNKEEAIEQLQRLSLDWEENSLNTRLNQTDINAIKIIVSELDTANKKLDKIKEYIENNSLYEEEYDYDYDENIQHTGTNDEKAKRDILSIIGGE